MSEPTNPASPGGDVPGPAAGSGAGEAKKKDALLGKGPGAPGLDRLVILTLIGRVNVGKSSLCNALLRRDLASVDARSGWTKEITIYPVSEQLAVADTPGLDDPNPLLQDAAFDAVGDTDLFLHVHNLDEGVGQSAREALARLRSAGRPLAVVFNKCDLLPETLREELVRQGLAKLGAEGLPVFTTSAVSGERLQELADWIDDQVKGRGDELAWARVCRRARPLLEDRLEKQAADCVSRYSLMAGGAGAIPLPIVDLPIILGLQVKMAHALGRIYGIELSASRLKELIGLVAGGLVIRQVGRQLAKFIPWVGWALSGAVAFGGTFGLGKALALYYKSGMRTDAEELRRIYQEELEKARVRFQTDPDLRKQAEAEGRRGAREASGEE
ncbi:MAG: 50S ribosome-binding GTPase [Planctomycetes bacterium]|nr:50S ribosome-binding GTPase [Planctomycetota bacterium]